MPGTGDKRESNGLWELTAVHRDCVDLGWEAGSTDGGECSLAEEWEMKLERQEETRS